MHVAADVIVRLVLLPKPCRRIEGVDFEAQLGHLVIKVELASDPKRVCERALRRARW